MNRGLCFCLTVLAGILNVSLVFSFGALFLPLLDTFSADRSTTTTVQSLLLGVTLCFGVVAGILMDRVGLPLVLLVANVTVPSGFCVSFFVQDIHILYLTIGIVAGTGVSVTFIGGMAVTGRMFTSTHKVLFAGLYSSAISVSVVVYSYILDALVKQFGLRGTFLILGGLTSHSFALTVMVWMNRSQFFMAISNNTVTEEDAGKRENCDNAGTRMTMIRATVFLMKCKLFCKSLLTKTFLLLLFGAATLVATVNSYRGLAMDVAKSKGIEGAQALSSFMVLNCASAVGNIIPGLLRYICPTNRNPFVFLMTASTVGVIGFCFIYLSDAFAFFVSGSAIVGFALGFGIISALNTVVEIQKPKRFAVAFGLINTMNGSLCAGLGPTYGALSDIFDSYTNVILLACALMASATLCFLIAFVIHRKNTSRDYHEQVFSVVEL